MQIIQLSLSLIHCEVTSDHFPLMKRKSLKINPFKLVSNNNLLFIGDTCGFDRRNQMYVKLIFLGVSITFCYANKFGS